MSARFISDEALFGGGGWDIVRQELENAGQSFIAHRPGVKSGVHCYHERRVTNRRSLIPSGADPGRVHATRRGEARHELSARVSLKPTSGPPVNGAPPLEGWALNVSRGGLRVILEQKVDLGAEFEVTIASPDPASAPKAGRVVWVQEEPDGVVAGIEFRDVTEE